MTIAAPPRMPLASNTTTEISPIFERQTRWMFLALCTYILSQAYTIPVVPIGPWSLWPRLGDFAIGFLLLSWLGERRCAGTATRAHGAVFQALVLLGGLGTISYLVYLIAGQHPANAPGVVTGLFQLYLFGKFGLLYWLVTQIPLTPPRLHVLERLTGTVLLFVAVAIIATYFNILPLSAVAPQLPKSPGVAGLWYLFNFKGDLGERRGWGTIGYDHIYVAAQVVLLTGLYFHLARDRFRLRDGGLVLLALFACFLSNSRSGLAAMLFLIGVRSLRIPRQALVLCILMLLAGAAMLAFKGDSTLPILQSTIQRQETLTSATNADNLAGRDEIWQHRVDYLDEEPVRWLIGTGFGAARDSGTNAHFLALHITTELGLIGLLCYALLFAIILTQLYRGEAGHHSLFWTTVALLVSSFAQETFYPLPNFGHFIGLYLCTLAIAFRRPIFVTTNQDF